MNDKKKVWKVRRQISKKDCKICGKVARKRKCIWMKRKIEIEKKYHFISVFDRYNFQDCKAATLQNKELFLSKNLELKAEKSAKRRMESAKCRPINDTILKEKIVLRAINHVA